MFSLRAVSLFFTSLLTLLLSTSSLAANFDSVDAPLAAFSAAPANDHRFVPVDQAFPFNFIQQGNKVKLDWQIKDGYYLYKERFSFSTKDAKIADAIMPEGEFHHDEFFGDVHVFKQPVSVEIPLQQVGDKGQLIVQYQGCATTGFCYPPETRVIPLDALNTNQTTNNQTANAHSEQTQASATQTLSTQSVVNQPVTTQPAANHSEDAGIAAQLSQHWWTPFLFLALGIGLAFTPCVLPMYPILTGIVLGGGKLSAGKAFKLSFVYVQGMALTYMLLGLVVASLGVQFQAALQAPAVLIGLSVLFVLLAMSMFGVYTIQLPSRMQTWLNEQSNKQQGGNLIGVFAMGIISGLVCSPCTTAPLSGALLYVAQSGDLITGAIALYALAIGMGIPLICVAVFGNKLLPKAGEWMNKVKMLFGFILLAAPIFLLERILPVFWVELLWSGLGLVAFTWLYHIRQFIKAGSWAQSITSIIAMLGLMLAFITGLQAFGFNPLGNTVSQQQDKVQVEFVRIHTVADLDQQLLLAKQAGKPVMFDYYADWCVACKEFEKYTFHNPQVAAKLQNMVLLQADVTNANPQDIALMEKMKVLGLPTIEFWDAQGKHVTSARITGFMDAANFLSHLTKNGLAPNH
ncbi:protein-disulfide reductase DsbD [Vibrio sp. S11_S32]|uniref:protein-disulfide reductase DsbD n=1 Tax=Vibrio sp. S11_S32 TaxID=2720225 RepID=UPI0016812915|nr:protein-disulfide reductase DsbD [Vibrio sp. S11_S32]MBD1575797.1 protein-disulfide reductase DsbD [Vibrio sp. S11_S32]